MLFTKKTLLNLTLSTLLCGSVVAANVAYAKPKFTQGAGSEQRLQQKFNRMDTSGDELLSLDEFIAKLEGRTERRFNRRDRDDDGFISLEEATTSRNGDSPDHSDIAEEIVSCVEELAANDDEGLINVPDADKFSSPEDRFNDADSSGDGFLDLEEVQAKALNKATDSFTNMDSDDDGFVSFDEFSHANDVKKATRSAIRECIAELAAEEIV